MDLGLSGRVALVSGGSKGIGRATALRLAAEGASVMVCARGAAALDETVALAAGSPGRIVCAQADLTDPNAIADISARCVRELGALEILVNNAGSARTGAFLKLSDQEWLDDFNLKFFGYVRMARAALAYMQRQRAGVIVNVIGTGGLMPAAGYMIGGAANAALNHFTKALAQEGARAGVRVVGVNPGPIMTERLLTMFAQRNPNGRPTDEELSRMTPLGRPGKPEEVADLIAFLASPRAAFIHGANITIDGGANRGLMG